MGLTTIQKKNRVINELKEENLKLKFTLSNMQKDLNGAKNQRDQLALVTSEADEAIETAEKYHAAILTKVSIVGSKLDNFRPASVTQLKSLGSHLSR